MRFFITGIAGFLGSTLAKKLIEDGHEVRGLDNLSSGKADNVHPEVVFEQGDVNDAPKLWSLMQDVDTVIHLAARVSVRESMRYPRDYNHTNVGGTVSVLEAMRDTSVKRLVFSSSGAIYGQQDTSLMHEALPPNPESPYAVSKLASEYYIRTTGRLWGIDTITLRIFNAYGVGQYLPPANPPVIPQFFKQILGGGSVVINGDGHQTRDFVYLDDVVTALARAANLSAFPDHPIVNVGSGVETSILDLAALIGEITKKKPNLLPDPKPEPNAYGMQADLTQLKTVLGFVPQFSLETGLQHILENDERFSG